MGNNSCIDCSRRNKLKEINNEIFEGILEQECLLWDIFQNRFRRTKFFVTKPKNNKISYISDNGSIMRIEQIRDQQLQQSEILTNIEQIKFLKWIGQYGNNQQKIGRWKAFWQGESLIGIGGIYSEDGQKQGQWNLLFQNYTKEFQVCESGEYLNDQKIKLWKYTLGNEEIGGGLYDNQGKQGQWIELANNFQVHSQITLIGEYKNGKKVGRWDTYHRMKNQQQFQLIGGGTYDIQEGSNSFKIGIWKEPSEGFHSRNKVMYEGQYKNGIKVGRWEIQMIQDTGMMMKIGGGEYDDKQEANNHLSMKQGKWLELNDLLQISSQVIYQGEYKNGLKIGRWEIYWKDDDDGSFNLIAGGLYKPKLDDQFSGDIKQGRWVELSEGFRNSSQITWKGVYQNNNKVGRWDISFQWENYGGGSYNEVDAELIVKVGKWFELSDQFSKFQILSILQLLENIQSFIKEHIKTVKKLVDGMLFGVHK
ncbi:unnamed protein product [Paramecium sonneborni]|uniref:Uncharacterized protein n=1 Tax=Paramecium sonneborni TaxID=65129 RepID=A0A8S1PLB1_9CILI|nr:unnamed protein product [Paramecium sonneborni]